MQRVTKENCHGKEQFRQAVDKKEEVRQRWKERFVEAPNRSKPEQEVDVISVMEVKEEIPLGPIAKTEIRGAILSISAGTAPDIDGIIVELL